MRKLLKAFKSLSDETRLRILNILIEQECCVCEVMQALDISQSRASRNLGILHDAGLIESKRDGVWTVYFIDRAACQMFLPQLVEIVREELKDNPQSITDIERLRSAERVGPGCVR